MNLRRKAETLKTQLDDIHTQLEDINENQIKTGKFNRKEFRKYSELRVSAAAANEALMDIQVKMEKRPRFLKALFKTV